MGQERDSHFYDERLTNFLVEYETSIWKSLYDTVADLMQVYSKDSRILDVGCGTGRLAVALGNVGFRNYVGFDFSIERIKEARRYLPNLVFQHLNVYAEEAKQLYNSADVVCMTELLEHLEKDRELLQLVPHGKRIVLSVPNSDGAAHVRWFKTLEAVYERFGDLIDIEKDASRVIERGRIKIFVVRGRRA